MALAEHLYPVTFWEKRCELLEQSVTALSLILARNLAYMAQSDLQVWNNEWNRLLEALSKEYPAPPTTPAPPP